MRGLIVIAFSLFSLSLFAQLETRFCLAGNFTSTTDNGGGDYTVSITFDGDQSGNNYLASDIVVGWRLITALGASYEIEVIDAQSIASITVQVASLDDPVQFPAGRVIVYQYSAETPTIPLIAQNLSGITPAFAAIIHTHNSIQVGLASPGGLDTVYHDNTLIGSGNAEDSLKVDTNLIATQNYVINELDNRIEVYGTLVYESNSNSVALPFVPDTRYPIMLVVNGQVLSQGAGADFTLSGSTLNLVQTIFDGWRVTYTYTKLQ